MNLFRLKEFKMALSLFTTLPIGNTIEWDQDSMKSLPNYLPLVGAVLGLLIAGVYSALWHVEVNQFLKAVLMAITTLLLTGGFHMDGLMDTCDGHFSRRDLPRRLEIMKDSRVGAFAVMGFVSLFLLKIGVFVELFQGQKVWVAIASIPLLSRILLLILLKKAPYAKDEGLGKMYGTYGEKWDFKALALYGVISLGLIILNPHWVFLCLSGPLFLFIYIKWSIRSFEGITGDLLGAFLELCEGVLLLTLAVGGII